MAKWAYGFWQCKEHYATQKELLRIASDFRKRQIPIDNIVQDWYYWVPHPWGSHDFDLTRYPNMKQGIADLHKLHFHFMISVWGKFAKGSTNYSEMASKGYLYPGTGDGYDPITTRYYDAFNPGARHLYWNQINHHLYKLGVDAWWLDASEPEIPTHDFRTFKTYLGPAEKVLIAYPLMHTQGVDHGQLRTNPNNRVFILTRSAYLGLQRNSAAVWSGDIDGTWPVFKDEVSIGLDYCMSGLPYWTTDIGGFFSRSPSDPDYRQLFTCWFEWGAFCPIFRVHGTGANKEPWRFGSKVEKILVKYDALRYRLLPYIYSDAWQITSNGGTMMRALVMDYRTDPNVANIGDEFMFGPDLLVAPVVERNSTSREVYLPKADSWYDFWTGNRVPSGNIKVAAPLGKLPLFVRAGSILPFGQKLQYAMQKPWNEVELRVYPGKNGHFTLYDDDGVTNKYEKGAHSEIPITWNNRDQILEIHARKGSFQGMPKNIHFRIVVSGTGDHWSRKPLKIVDYSGRTVRVKL